MSYYLACSFNDPTCQNSQVVLVQTVRRSIQTPEKDQGRQTSTVANIEKREMTLDTWPLIYQLPTAANDLKIENVLSFKSKIRSQWLPQFPSDETLLQGDFQSRLGAGHCRVTTTSADSNLFSLQVAKNSKMTFAAIPQRCHLRRLLTQLGCQDYG